MAEKQRKKILMVEDEVELVEGMKRLLEKLGYLIIAAYDTATGLELVQKETADLVILDLAIPGGGGFSILKEARQGGANKVTPVLVITASTEKMVRDEAETIGVDGYMCKPFEPAELIQNIKDIIGE
ncbi:MAG: response regulator [Candidatus Omnitrophica bacterium]|nr:response regulator [Candidatus Omnitrophota bacterium]MBU1128047.1 response regulator [Candidatus Omnitrophota bacterium]MBU1784634.1 response regulator [Candidatus Omnitrophota bacterium]MBU1851160.1 response regulator [Candidatus Omnitrophota bacterium]